MYLAHSFENALDQWVMEIYIHMNRSLRELLLFHPEPGCQDTEFQCSNGNCVDSRRTCDGRNDCGDGSDEAPAQCGGDLW